MPQMAPMAWTSLFISFSFLFLIIMTKTFFLSDQKLTTSSMLSESKNNQLLWMW